MDYLWSLFLKFAHEEVLIPLILIGLISSETRRLYIQVVEIVALSFISNVLFKSIFQVPLAPHLNKVGYALPSGHMQMVICVYGWCLINNFALGRYFFVIPTILLFFGHAYALIHFGYHSLADVIAAWFSGAAVLLGYYLIAKTDKRGHQLIPLYSGVIGLIITMLIKGAIIGLHAYIGVVMLLTIGILKTKFNQSKPAMPLKP